MPRSVIDDSYDPIYDQVRGILGEHFENYCFIVMNSEGEIFFDFKIRYLTTNKMENIEYKNGVFTEYWSCHYILDKVKSKIQRLSLTKTIFEHQKKYQKHIFHLCEGIQ